MGLSQLWPDLLILGMFVIAIYAFSVLPRRRDFRQRQKLVSQLKPGAEVITYGGLVGTVRKVDAANGMIILEVAKGVEMRFLAQAISSEFDAKAIADSARRASN